MRAASEANVWDGRMETEVEARSEGTLGSSGGVAEQVGGPADEGATEARLLSRLQRGEAGAFEALVEAHQDRLFDFCVRLLGDREEAFDVLQEVFVSVHQNLGSFRSEARLSTWLLRISKNHCLNRLKYLKRRGRGASSELTEVSEAELHRAASGSPGGGPGRPDEALEAARERRLLHRAIGSLGPDERLLVALRDIEGLPYEEIAEVAELPLGTVKSRLHRAREQLAEAIVRLEAGQSLPGEEPEPGAKRQKKGAWPWRR